MEELDDHLCMQEEQTYSRKLSKSFRIVIKNDSTRGHGIG
jgi:hypothetical protein